MGTEYRVRYKILEIWEVYLVETDKNEYLDYYISEEKVFEGTLADCDAFIRLKQGGYFG